MGGETRSDGLETLSSLLGWVYFSCWSISFYPQVYLNWKRKSVVGYSFDYVAYNISGYLFYSTYTIVSFIQQHRLGLTEAVAPNDVAFAVHGVILMLILIGQCCIYERQEQKVHPAHGFAVACMWFGAIINCFLAFSDVIPFYTHNPPGVSHSTPAYSVLEYCGYCKVFVSFIKNCPQAYLNYKTRSTAGWSTVNVNLDITGGLLSFAQQGIDAYNQGDASVLTGNIPKMMLAVESILFDILYLIQRFLLYPPSKYQSVPLGSPGSADISAFTSATSTSPTVVKVSVSSPHDYVPLKTDTGSSNNHRVVDPV